MTPSPDLPTSADVVVLGGGLAGCAVAALLAESDARVVVLERAPRGAGGFSACTHGAVGLGYADHPVRLVRSLGEDTARALVQASAENLAMLRARGLLQGEGHLTAALGATETPEIALSVDHLAQWGLPVEPLDADQVAVRLHGARLGPGWWDPRGGWVDPAEGVAQVAAWATDAGATVVHGATVTHTRDGRPETEVHGECGGRPFVVRADVVVHAAGLAERSLDPFFDDKVFPVRFQMQRLRRRPAAPGPLPPFSAQLSYLQGAPRADGAVVLGGCRWATPHLETGETDATSLSPAVDDKLTAVRQGVLGPCLGDSEVVARHAGIMTFTCDGLPIVGPLPGRVGHLSLLGWNGRPWSHALRGARALTDGLMTGRSEGWPALLTPQRFV